MKISNKEAALLGLLHEKPMHGYEIEQEVKQRDMRYWTEISISSIYKVLKKLEEKGWVKVEVKLTENNVAQKINTITGKGKTALKEKVCSLFEEFDHRQWDLDIAISNLYVLKAEEAAKCISAYIRHLEELVTGYGELEKYLVSSGCPPFRMALATRPQYIYKAEIAWAKDYLKTIKNTNKP